MNCSYLLLLCSLSLWSFYASAAADDLIEPNQEDQPPSLNEFKKSYDKIYDERRPLEPEETLFHLKKLQYHWAAYESRFYKNLERKKVDKYIELSNVNEIKCNPDTYDYNLEPPLEEYESTGSLKIHFRYYRNKQAQICLEYFIRELKSGVETGVDLKTIIELIKKTFFGVAGSDTWPRVSGGQNEVPYTVAVKNLMNLLEQPQIVGQQEAIEKLQERWGSLKDRAKKGVEPLIILIFDYILKSIDDDRYDNRYLDVDMPQSILDLLVDVKACNSLFEAKVNPVVMALCLLNNQAQLGENALRDLGLAKINPDRLGSVPEKYLNVYYKKEITLHDKYKSEYQRIHGRLFSLTSGTFNTEDTVWFLKRMLKLKLEGSQKEKEMEPKVELLKKLIEASLFSPYKCDRKSFPFHSTGPNTFYNSIELYLRWCRNEQIKICFEIFQDKFRETAKRLEPEHTNLMRIKNIIYPVNDVHRFGMYQDIEIPYDLGTDALLDFMEQKLGSLDSYTIDTEEFKNDLKLSLSKLCSETMFNFNIISEQFFDLFTEYYQYDFKYKVDNEIIDLIAVRSICRAMEKTNTYINLAANKFEKKYPMSRRKANKLIGKCGLGGCIKLKVEQEVKEPAKKHQNRAKGNHRFFTTSMAPQGLSVWSNPGIASEILFR